MLELSKKLVSTLNERGISWLIWKGCNHCSDGFNGNGDVDILVHLKYKSDVYLILRELGFIYFQTQKSIVRKDVEDWLGLDLSSGKLIHVHLHFSMVYGYSMINQYHFKIYNDCFSHRIQFSDGIYIQHPFYELLLAFTMLELGELDSKKVNRYLQYFNRDDVKELITSIYDESVSAGIQMEEIYKAISGCKRNSKLRKAALKLSACDYLFPKVRNWLRTGLAFWVRHRIIV